MCVPQLVETWSPVLQSPNSFAISLMNRIWNGRKIFPCYKKWCIFVITLLSFKITMFYVSMYNFILFRYWISFIATIMSFIYNYFLFLNLDHTESSITKLCLFLFPYISIMEKRGTIIIWNILWSSKYLWKDRIILKILRNRQTI